LGEPMNTVVKSMPYSSMIFCDIYHIHGREVIESPCLLPELGSRQGPGFDDVFKLS
jgi:hypothetical protein